MDSQVKLVEFAIAYAVYLENPSMLILSLVVARNY